MSNTIPSTELIGEEFQGNNNNKMLKYSDIVSTPNGKLYCIPCQAYQVLTLDIKHNQWRTIGNEFAEYSHKWFGGSYVPNNGKIFCSPCDSNNVLVIDTNNDTTTLVPIPDELCNCNRFKYQTCVLDNDNENVLFFPHNASKIIQISVNAPHEVCVVEDVDCGKFWIRVVRASNGFIYGISFYNEILKFNPNDRSFEKQKMAVDNMSIGAQYSDLVEHKDGHLYALPFHGQKVLKINMNTLQSSTVGEHLGCGWGKWNKSILGSDSCIYGIPFCTSRVARFDPFQNTVTMVGESFDGETKWYGGCLASDGNIYSAPFETNKVLMITISTTSSSSWGIVKEHVMLRWLMERQRAFAIQQHHHHCGDDNDNEHLGQSYYRHFVESLNDDLFRMILQFL